jgi:hypothetical protein
MTTAKPERRADNAAEQPPSPPPTMTRSAFNSFLFGLANRPERELHPAIPTDVIPNPALNLTKLSRRFIISRILDISPINHEIQSVDVLIPGF